MIRSIFFMDLRVVFVLPIMNILVECFYKSLSLFVFWY